MSDHDDESDDLLKGPGLTRDGHLERRLQAVEPEGQRPPPPVADAPLELAQRPPKAPEPIVEHFRSEPPKRRSPWLAVTVVGALFVVGLLVGMMVFRPNIAPPSPDGINEPTVLDTLQGEAEPIIISSTPTGARVTIDGTFVGTTPWAGDNRWNGEVEVLLTAPGYAQWKKTITGRSPTTLDATLTKAPPGQR